MYWISVYVSFISTQVFIIWQVYNKEACGVKAKPLWYIDIEWKWNIAEYNVYQEAHVAAAIIQITDNNSYGNRKFEFDKILFPIVKCVTFRLILI